MTELSSHIDVEYRKLKIQLISLEGTNRGKGQQSIKNNFNILVSMSIPGADLLLTFILYPYRKQNTFVPFCLGASLKLPAESSGSMQRDFPSTTATFLSLVSPGLLLSLLPGDETRTLLCTANSTPLPHIYGNTTTSCQLTAAAFMLYIWNERNDAAERVCSCDLDFFFLPPLVVKIKLDFQLHI